MRDSSATVDDLKAVIHTFTKDRGWNPDARSLAISISIEAAELLEHFQWRRYTRKGDRDKVTRELADVVILQPSVRDGAQDRCRRGGGREAGAQRGQVSRGSVRRWTRRSPQLLCG